MGPNSRNAPGTPLTHEEVDKMLSPPRGSARRSPGQEEWVIKTGIPWLALVYLRAARTRSALSWAARAAAKAVPIRGHLEGFAPTSPPESDIRRPRSPAVVPAGLRGLRQHSGE
jgi:hypothetical protein